MRLHHIAALCFGATALIVYAPRAWHEEKVAAGIGDPAFRYYTKGHSPHYAAVDQWAYYGMQAELFVDVLRRAGYACNPPVAKHGAATLREVTCHETRRWPVGRTLAIRASFEPGSVERLVSATASSTLPADAFSFSVGLASWLRRTGWIEPASLPVAGFYPDSVETLARMVTDALSDGWLDRCTGGWNDTACQQWERDRKQSGFPALQASMPGGAASEVAHSMARIRFTPVQLLPSGVAPQPDSLLVRTDAGRMWLDFVSRDLTGRKLAASVELESSGGTPVALVVSRDDETMSVRLAGERNLDRDGTPAYLAPLAAMDNPRQAVWLYMPEEKSDPALAWAVKTLPLVDQAFIEPVAMALIDHRDPRREVEETLGLYPRLRQIERKAMILHALHPEGWLPVERGNRLVARAYPDDPVKRAAWAFATCKLILVRAEIDSGCLLRFKIADPEAAALVRDEITALQQVYRNLPEKNPLRARLQFLGEEFAIEREADDSPGADEQPAPQAY